MFIDPYIILTDFCWLTCLDVFCVLLNVNYFCPRLPSDSRFITLMKQAMFPMTLFTQLHSGKRIGIYIICWATIICAARKSNWRSIYNQWKISNHW